MSCFSNISLTYYAGGKRTLKDIKIIFYNECGLNAQIENKIYEIYENGTETFLTKENFR